MFPRSQLMFTQKAGPGATRNRADPSKHKHCETASGTNVKGAGEGQRTRRAPPCTNRAEHPRAYYGGALASAVRSAWGVPVGGVCVPGVRRIIPVVLPLCEKRSTPSAQLALILGCKNQSTRYVYQSTFINQQNTYEIHFLLRVFVLTNVFLEPCFCIHGHPPPYLAS